MSVDAVIRPLAVHPRQDAQDHQRRERHHDDEHPPSHDDARDDTQPQRNAYGQLIGKTINITV